MLGISVSATYVSPASLALREVAAEEPGRTALEIDDRRISYGEFNDEADRLAQRLVRDVGGDSRIALRANGTHELAVGFLGIQRAGLVAVPVDPTAPLERLQTILADVEPSLLLSDVDGDEELGLPVPVFHPLRFGADMDAVPVDRDRPELASIVYTSGSTGVPKGIMMSREQLAALSGRLPDYQIPSGARLGGLTAGTVSYIEQLIGGALVLRGTLVAYEIRRHGLAPLGPWLASAGIAAFATVPTVLRYLLPTLPPDLQFSSVRTVVLSGETSTWDDVVQLRRHLPPEAVIFNSFGLTETSGIASHMIRGDMPVGDGPLPAGALSPDMEVSILDPAGEPVPPGERGEITVRSHVLALGYWRRPDLTRATFRALADGRREVRTGDAGRLLPDGTLEHLGRLDHLVKISGNRVELGEVEAALSGLAGVGAAAAAPYVDDTQSTRLAACVVAAADVRLDPRALRAILARRLPGYMVPDRVVVVDAVPQLPGGKVDRARVAELRAAPSGDAAPESASDLETSLAAIWREILELERIDRHDDFFEIGGDSMRAARMFVLLERRLGIDRPLSLLAEAPTLASLALMLADDESWGALLAVRSEGTRPPLFAVHDGIGGVLHARGLAAELDADQPIYALRCEGLNGTPLRARSLEQLAATYVTRIRALYPHGPYLLHGVSLGGVLALEMARQLLDDGDAVPLLALGDSAAPSGITIPPTKREHRATQLRELREMGAQACVRQLAFLAARHLTWRLDPEVRRERAADRLAEQARQRGEPIPVNRREQYVLREYGRLLVDYKPRPPFPPRALLLRTGGPGGCPDRGWGAFFGSALTIVDLPGTHVDLGREAWGAYVGPALQRAIDGLDQDAGAAAPQGHP